MSYAVKEMFLTLQGEGVNAGARAVFLRFAGCNLWSGRERDRATAVCRFCDTDFVGTGGEPMLQIDDAIVEALHAEGFRIAIESNGTLPVHPRIDWVCISPKAGSEVVQRSGDELKLVWPQAGIDPDAIEGWDFAHHLVQPLDDRHADANRDACIALAMARPRWRLSLQTHKLLGLR